MAEITLVAGKIGITNVNQDHYLRNNSLNIQGNDLNELLAARLGTTNRVDPSTVNNVSLRTAGLSGISLGTAFIEGGWDVSRGVCYLEFDISNAGLVNNKMGVYGYLHGGSEMIPGRAPPNDIIFVPVRYWSIETTETLGVGGIEQLTNKMVESSQYILNDERVVGGSCTARPCDVVKGSVILTTDEQTEVNLADALLGYQGVVKSTTADGNPIEYSNKLLKAAMTSAFNSRGGIDSSTSIGEASKDPELYVDNAIRNPFLKVMMIGLGTPSLVGFHGFSFGQIASVFHTFDEPGVINTELINQNMGSLEDFRISTNAHNGADYQTLIANDLLFIVLSVISKYRLSYLQFRMDNNVNQGQIMINNLPVAYQLGEAMPMMTADTDFQYNPTIAVEEIINYLYHKYNSAYVHERRLVYIQAEIALFGEAKILVQLDGNQATQKVFNFVTGAGNRIDPNLTTTQGLTQLSHGFFNQLKNNLGV